MLNIKNSQIQFRQNRMIFGIILICSVLMGLMQYFTPYSFDDLIYLLPYHDFKEGLSNNLDLSSYWDFFFSHYKSVNSRLGDKLLPLFLLLPKWLFATITGLAFYIIFWYSVKILNSKSIYTNCLLTTLLIFLLPLHDYAFNCAVTVNYIFGLSLILPLVYIFLKPEKTKISYFIVIPLAIIASAWHEIFTIPIGFALIITAIFNFKAINKQQFAIILSGILGGLFIILSPSIWNRANSMFIPYQSQKFLYTLFLSNISIVFIILWMIILFSQKHRDRICSQDRKICIFSAVTIIINIFIFWKFPIGGRVMYVGLLFGIIGFVILLKNWYSHLFNFRSTKHIIIVLSLFSVTHLSYSIHWQQKYNNEHNYIIAELLKSDTGCVFYDPIGESAMPLICMRRPLSNEFTTGEHNLEKFANYYTSSTKKLIIIPSSLKNAEPDNSRLINENMDVYEVDNKLYSRNPISPNSIIKIKCKNNIEYTPILTNVFKYTNLNGNIYYYIQPIPGYLDKIKIKDEEITELIFDNTFQST